MLYSRKVKKIDEQERNKVCQAIREVLKDRAASLEIVEEGRKKCREEAVKNKESISLKSDILTAPFI